MQKVDYRNVIFKDGFWKRKETLNHDVTLGAVYDRFKETGRIDAFSCKWKPGDPNKPHFFWDSDVAKWIEGASYDISRTHDPDLMEKAEWLIDRIEENQGDDGYFNIYYTVVEKSGRFTLRSNHELYCAGHLMEAAVAYYEATGRDRFLKIMEKYASYIKSVFMDGDGNVKPTFQTSGHEEIELALYMLYKATGNRDWLELFRFFVDKRGNNPLDPVEEYTQSNLPVRKIRRAVGHSVRAGYLYAAMADYAREFGDSEMAEACRLVFNDITSKRIYVTGGIGSEAHGERFGEDYALGNLSAYAETCASIAMMLFAQRMNLLERNARYTDIVELEMYNGMLSGVSLDGDSFFYQNVLEIDDSQNISYSHTVKRRAKLFECSCCPPNINRTLASMEQYFYSKEGNAVYINQFGNSEYCENGIRVVQETRYPMDGKIRIKISGADLIYVRIPGWCSEFKASQGYAKCNGYAVFANPKDIMIDFCMKPVFVKADKRIKDTLGKVAVKYGPIVYCAESCDNIKDLNRIRLNITNPEWEITCDEVHCVCMLEMNGFEVDSPSLDLYSELYSKMINKRIRLIPYHMFANRDISNMKVWIEKA